MYDRGYAVAKAPLGGGDWEVAQLLGEHQAQAAARREAPLMESMRSLFQRLGLDDPELAQAYDAAYGRQT